MKIMAMIAVLPIWHPDIYKFITCKRGSANGKLTNFNISVSVDDRFMEAYFNDSTYDLRFPDIMDPHYTEENWDGNIDNYKGPIKIYETVKARDLMKEIMMSAYNFAGTWDFVHRYS